MHKVSYFSQFILQVPDRTQRLEELAIKQSRQLIPMTPSMPKALVRYAFSYSIVCSDTLGSFSSKGLRGVK